MQESKTSFFDIVFLNLKSPIDWSGYEKKPTACLLVIDKAIDRQWLSLFVKRIVGLGCEFFLCWGSEAEQLHDKIDEILEGGDDEWLSVSTISCLGETAEDVSITLFIATYPNRVDVRYLVVTDGSVDALRNEIIVPAE